MLVLLDQNVPIGVRRILTNHDVRTAYRMGWADLSNGELIDAAQAAGIAVLVTCDQNIVFQQGLSGRQIAMVVLATNSWAVIRTEPAELRTQLWQRLQDRSRSSGITAEENECAKAGGNDIRRKISPCHFDGVTLRREGGIL
jgi:hypothetical protein